MISSRRPRFRRTSDIPPFALTGRDSHIIRYLAKYRFLRSSHLLLLIPGSQQQILRRLQLLFHHGYVDRPTAQIDYYQRGSKAMIYGLGKQGMRFLHRENGLAPGKLDWTTRNQRITRYFMQHTLAVADVLVAVELSCRANGLEFVRHPSTAGGAFKWKVPLRLTTPSISIAVVPDAVFGLKSGSHTRWFFLEADRATMPVERNNLKQTSFGRKLLAYHETWRLNPLRDSFPRFQVLTVTTTPERASHLAQTARRLTRGKGAGLFLFTDHSALTAWADIFKIPFLNARGERVFVSLSDFQK